MFSLRVQEKRIFMTDSELVRLFRVIDDDIAAGDENKHLTIAQRNARRRNKMYFEFLLNTGLRREEAINLRREDVQLEKRLIYVANKTKSYRSRIVPLNERALDVLEAVGPDLFSKINKETATQKFCEYLTRAGLKGFKLHSLRHTFATNLIDRGVDIYTVSKILGHSDIKTTMVYAKVNIAVLHDAVGKLNKDGYVLVTRQGENDKGQ